MTNNSLLNIKQHFHPDPFISYEESARCQAKRRNRLWSPKVHINAETAAKHVTHTKIPCLQNAVGTQDALHFAEAEKLQRCQWTWVSRKESPGWQGSSGQCIQVHGGVKDTGTLSTQQQGDFLGNCYSIPGERGATTVRCKEKEGIMDSKIFRKENS